MGSPTQNADAGPPSNDSTEWNAKLAAARDLVGESAAGRLLLAHMLVIERIVERTRTEGSISHEDLIELLHDALCAVPQEAGEGEDAAAAEVLWQIVLELVGDSDALPKRLDRPEGR